MLGFFIKSGPLVQIRDNRGNIQVYRDNDGGEQLYDGKMSVITNLASASASEIFAAAIQDYGRGLVVGSTTTGKGSAQIQLDSLALGSATLTQRKFYRVTGGSTQNKGVVPDVELVNIYDDATFGERAQKKKHYLGIRSERRRISLKGSLPVIRWRRSINSLRFANRKTRNLLICRR